MRYYQMDRTTGCLLSAFIMLVIFSFVTAIGRFLFTTPVGWTILAFIIIRHLWVTSMRQRQQEVFRQQAFEQKQKMQEEALHKEETRINVEDIVDVDYVEVIDLEKDKD